MPKVSVVVPTYNCGEYIENTIRSVLNQSYKDLELIIVDGGSNDATDEIAEKYKKDTRFIYLKKPDYGVSAARNYGIKTARGDLIVFLDGDDIFLKNRILKQVRFFENNKHFDACYTNTIYFDSMTRKEVLCTYYHFSGDIFCYIKRNNFIHPSCLMVRKKICKENLFDENMGLEDWEFCLRLAYKGIRFAFMNEVLTKIRVTKKGISTDLEFMSRARRATGLKGKEYWKSFKKEITLFSRKGQKALLRYLKFKIGAFLIGFPNRKCFNRTVARELL